MITIIAGLPGRGKTAFLAKNAIECMLNGKADYLAMKKEISLLNSNGFSLELPPQKHLCYSDVPIHFGRKFKTYSVNAFEIALPNPFFETVFLPPFSKVFIDEAQRVYDSRMSKYIRQEVYMWYQFHRHNDYEVFMNCQRLMNIDVNIRQLAEQFIIMDGVEIITNNYGFVDKIIFNTHIFNSENAAVDYQEAKDKKTVANLGEEKAFETDIPIFSCYNSKSQRPAFYYGNLNRSFDYYTEEGYQFTLDSFKEFNNSHMFCAPTGFYKNADYDKEILKKRGILYGN